LTNLSCPVFSGGDESPKKEIESYYTALPQATGVASTSPLNRQVLKATDSSSVPHLHVPVRYRFSSPRVEYSDDVPIAFFPKR